MNEDKKDDFDLEISENPSNGNVLDSIDEKELSSEDYDDLRFSIPIYRKIKIRIYKPLIPLKLVLFFWYGGGSFIGAFLTVYLKQRGLTLSELSAIFTLSPVVQILGTLLSGTAADKLGRSKPILVVNVLLTLLLLGGLLSIPRLNTSACSTQLINLKCHPQQFDRLITKTNCDGVDDVIVVHSCNLQCPENVTEHCTGQNLICEVLAGNEERRNFSLSITVGGSHKIKDRCYYNVSSMSHENATYSWCNVPHKMNCRVSCTVDSGIRCSDENDGRNALLITTFVLYILFMTTYSNCYRCLDIAAMTLVKNHGSDYGHERFFSIIGVLFLSPLAGLVIDSTTPAGAEKNYASVFYLFFGIGAVVLVAIYKLDVQLRPPGKNMWRKAIRLLKNPDFLSFGLVICVSGSAYAFTKNFLFWYLEGMNASSYLIGLIPAAGALYGLPFLITSKWWVNKLGATQVFVLNLLAYVVNTTGYSFLQDTWISLILEATNVFTYHLFWVAVVIHSHDLAPEGLTATIIASSGSIHYQISKISGSLIGGLIMDAFGGRIAFRVMGIICLISAVLYSLYLYVRRTCFTLRPCLDQQGQLEDGENSKGDFDMEIKK